MPAHFLDALDEEQWTTEWQGRLTQNARIVVAERSSDLVGFCAHGPAYHMDDLTNAWQIYALHVAPELRGGGIGSVLFADALAAAQHTGAAYLALWVLAANDPARRFYEAKGMRADGVTNQRELASDVTLREVRYSSSLQTIR